MKTMKFLSILTVILAFSQCGSVKFQENPPFTITAVTYQNWVGGQPGVQGKNVKISYTSDNEIEFDSIYFDKRITNLQTKGSENDKMVVGYFTSKVKKDIIMDENAVKEMNNPVPDIKKFPFKLKEDEAVISYKVKGEIKYYKITAIKKEKSAKYPTMRK